MTQQSEILSIEHFTNIVDIAVRNPVETNRISRILNTIVTAFIQADVKDTNHDVQRIFNYSTQLMLFFNDLEAIKDLELTNVKQEYKLTREEVMSISFSEYFTNGVFNPTLILSSAYTLFNLLGIVSASLPVNHIHASIWYKNTVAQNVEALVLGKVAVQPSPDIAGIRELKDSELAKYWLKVLSTISTQLKLI